MILCLVVSIRLKTNVRKNFYHERFIFTFLYLLEIPFKYEPLTDVLFLETFLKSNLDLCISTETYPKYNFRDPALL